jgi:hypothetical protein
LLSPGGGPLAAILRAAEAASSKPRAKKCASRDHGPPAFTVLLAGAGLPGGAIFGRTDRHAATVDEHAVRPADLTATNEKKKKGDKSHYAARPIMGLIPFSLPRIDSIKCRSFKNRDRLYV